MLIMRGAPIHTWDMKSLSQSIAKELRAEGHWVLSKTGNKYSAIPFDQAHEQENKVVKSAGSAVCLTENRESYCPHVCEKMLLSNNRLQVLNVGLCNMTKSVFLLNREKCIYEDILRNCNCEHTIALWTGSQAIRNPVSDPVTGPLERAQILGGVFTFFAVKKNYLKAKSRSRS